MPFETPPVCSASACPGAGRFGVFLIAVLLGHALQADRVVSEPDDLRARLAAAPRLAVENVVTPIHATRGGAVTWVPNPDGKTYDLVVVYYKADGTKERDTLYVDLGTGEIRRDHRNWGRGGGHIGPDGRLYQLCTVNGRRGLQAYDPGANACVEIEGVGENVGGETLPMVNGLDGVLYGAGSHDGRATLFSYDPRTGKSVQFGHVGPSHAPNRCWGYSIGVDDRYVYVASGKIPWYLVAYDRTTGTNAVLLTYSQDAGHLDVSGRGGCVVTTRSPTDPQKQYWLYQGRLTPREPGSLPPWPKAIADQAAVRLPPKPRLVGNPVPGPDGNVLLWYRPADAGPLPAAPPPDATPESLGWKAIRYSVPVYPYPVFNLVALPDGRVCGSGSPYIGNFVFNPVTGQVDSKGIIPLSQYSVVELGGHVYMSGYPSAALYRLDPGQPWTAGIVRTPWEGAGGAVDEAGQNPRRVAYLAHEGSGCHKMIAAAKARGVAYFGGHWARNGNQGGLGWWDPKTAQAGGLYKPFHGYQVQYMAATENERYLVISTRAVRDELTGAPCPDQARLFVFDTETKTIVRTIEPVPGALFTGPVAAAGGNRILAVTYDPAERADPGKRRGNYDLSYGYADTRSILYLVDVETGERLWQKTIPYPVGFRSNENAQMDGFSFVRGPDGKIWTFTGGSFVPCDPEHPWYIAYLGQDLSLVRVDPRDGQIEVVGKLDQPGELIFVGRDLYLSGGDRYLDGRNQWLRRVRGLVPER